MPPMKPESDRARRAAWSASLISILQVEHTADGAYACSSLLAPCRSSQSATCA
jgi:hypothetical protein